MNQPSDCSLAERNTWDAMSSCSSGTRNLCENCTYSATAATWLLPGEERDRQAHRAEAKPHFPRCPLHYFAKALKSVDESESEHPVRTKIVTFFKRKSI